MRDAQNRNLQFAIIQFVFTLNPLKKLIQKYLQYRLVKTNQNIIKHVFFITCDIKAKYLRFLIIQIVFFLQKREIFARFSLNKSV